MPVPTLYITAIASIIGFFFIKKFKKTKYIYFIYFLIYTFITELLAYVLGSIILIKNNPVYNLYALVSFFFYFTFYKNLFKNKINKIIMSVFIGLYILFSIIDITIFKTDYLSDFISNNIVFGSILLTITLILFLIEIINNETVIFNIKKIFIFWVSVGALLFYIGVIPIIITSKLLNFNGLYDSILTGLNIIMYGSFSLGYILSDKKYNY